MSTTPPPVILPLKFRRKSLEADDDLESMSTYYRDFASSSPLTSEAPFPATPFNSSSPPAYPYIRSSPRLSFEIALNGQREEQDIGIWGAGASYKAPPITTTTSSALHRFRSEHAGDSASSITFSDTEDEDDVEDDMDADVRGTYFRTSSERGQWKNDPRCLPVFVNACPPARRNIPDRRTPPPQSQIEISTSHLEVTLLNFPNPDDVDAIQSTPPVQKIIRLTDSQLPTPLTPTTDSRTPPQEPNLPQPSSNSISDPKCIPPSDCPKEPLTPLSPTTSISSGPLPRSLRYPSSPLQQVSSPPLSAISISSALSPPLSNSFVDADEIGLGRKWSPMSPVSVDVDLTEGRVGMDVDLHAAEMESEPLSPLSDVPETDTRVNDDLPLSQPIHIPPYTVTDSESTQLEASEMEDTVGGSLDSCPAQKEEQSKVTLMKDGRFQSPPSVALTKSEEESEGKRDPGEATSTTSIPPEKKAKTPLVDNVQKNVVDVDGSSSSSGASSRSGTPVVGLGDKELGWVGKKVRRDGVKAGGGKGVLRAKVKRVKGDGKGEKSCLGKAKEKRRKETDAEGPVRKKPRFTGEVKTGEDGKLIKRKIAKDQGGRSTSGPKSSKHIRDGSASLDPPSMASSNTKSSSLPPLDPMHLEICGMLIESLATSRASSLPASSLYKSVMQCRPTLKTERTEKEWISVIESVLEEGENRCGVFGKVDSSGMDDADHPLEAQWFYVPERDQDQDRATLIKSMMPRPAKRSETKKYKQYYYKPLGKISRWDPEDDL